METRTIGERLDGYKTYLAATGFAILGIHRLIDQRWEAAAEMLLVALATASLRHAITREAKPAQASYMEDHD